MYSDVRFLLENAGSPIVTQLAPTMENARLDEVSLESPEDVSRETRVDGSGMELVDACIAGDRQAKAQLYQRCSDKVYALMVRIVGRQDADDLTQHVFLKTFQKLQQFNRQSKLETWLHRLATNEALQHLRRRQRRSTAPLFDEPTAVGVDRIVVREEYQLLEEAMSQLEPELRVVLVLKEVERLSYQEIAASLGIPEGTVGSRLTRARKELRTELAKLGWE